MNEFIISILALIVSILGLGLSFYIVSRNKPKLYVEKDVLEVKKDENEIWIYFYLSNIGERPTTIKKIEFNNPISNFMPQTTCLKVMEKVSLGLNLGTSPPLKSYSPLDFPFLIDSNHTEKILAKLKFLPEEIFKEEMKRDKLTYKIRVNYSNKLYECMI